MSSSIINFKIPYLTQEEEAAICSKIQNGDKAALDKLITHSLPFARYMAYNYIGYGFPIEDLFQEACIGLMVAAKNFDPSVGVRFISFSVSHIKSKIFDYVCNNLRVVKFATTKPKRKLFFNYSRLTREGASDVEIAEACSCTLDDVNELRVYLKPELWIDNRSEDDEGETYITHVIVDDSDRIEEAIAEHYLNERSSKLEDALNSLKDRSKMIVVERHLKETKKPLSVIAGELGISAERVRQLELLAMKDLKTHMERQIA